MDATLAGGNYDPHTLYIAPTLITNLAHDATIMRDEIFGPLLPVFTFRTTAEAMDIVGRNPNPLAFYLFTSSKERVQQWVGKIAFGGGCINNALYHFASVYLPFGGVAARAASRLNTHSLRASLPGRRQQYARA